LPEGQDIFEQGCFVERGKGFGVAFHLGFYWLHGGGQRPLSLCNGRWTSVDLFWMGGKGDRVNATELVTDDSK
jgi:hypothetical protein